MSVILVKKHGSFFFTDATLLLSFDFVHRIGIHGVPGFGFRYLSANSRKAFQSDGMMACGPV